MVQVSTFKITYRGCEDKIWWIAELSSNSTLAQLGYMILATFDTLAYHLFSISFCGKTYEFDTDEEDSAEAIKALFRRSAAGIFVEDTFPNLLGAAHFYGTVKIYRHGRGYAPGHADSI